MATKQQLLEFVQGLPDDAEWLPLEMSECSEDFGDWESQHRSTDLGGVYQRSVDNNLIVRLHFKTREQGEFLRTYCDPEGSFRNLRRIQ